MIPVTKPYLPDIKKYQKYISDIYERNWLTNDGPLVQELERRLKEYLNVPYLLYVSNGTIALQLAIKALELKDEIITTPFSYVATSSSILWENCTPIYADIDQNTFNISPENIKSKITKKTMAILATHCFGNSCDINALEKIAKENKLKVIYDAAHAFGSTYKNKSLLEYGDISCCSLHATKLMHSIEGGIVICQTEEIFKKLFYLRNFGHDGPYKYNGYGINAKNSEFHAAMGLCVLEDINLILNDKKRIFTTYKQEIQSAAFQKINKNCTSNYSYVPVLTKSERDLGVIKNNLKASGIEVRRYFYPSLNELYGDEQICPHSKNIAKRILCLPTYFGLTDVSIKKICKIINDSIAK